MSAIARRHWFSLRSWYASFRWRHCNRNALKIKRLGYVTITPLKSCNYLHTRFKRIIERCTAFLQKRGWAVARGKWCTSNYRYWLELCETIKPLSDFEVYRIFQFVNLSYSAFLNTDVSNGRWQRICRPESCPCRFGHNSQRPLLRMLRAAADHH